METNQAGDISNQTYFVALTKTEIMAATALGVAHLQQWQREGHLTEEQMGDFAGVEPPPETAPLKPVTAKLFERFFLKALIALEGGSKAP